MRKKSVVQFCGWVMAGCETINKPPHFKILVRNAGKYSE